VIKREWAVVGEEGGCEDDDGSIDDERKQKKCTSSPNNSPNQRCSAAATADIRLPRRPRALKGTIWRMCWPVGAVGGGIMTLLSAGGFGERYGKKIITVFTKVLYYCRG